MQNDIQRAAEILRSGGLVAFPTETVYGLGADARSANAILGIFSAKGRPATNPLIVHVTDSLMACRYAAHWPPLAQQLANLFWPGPLTLVVKKRPEIVAQATAGRDTVALRAPDHPLAQALLREFDGPIAAPSANRSTRISPTTAQHVRRQLGDRVQMILDGGPCRVGIESTVLDLTTPTPRLLRPGGITLGQLRQAIGDVDYTLQITHQHVAATSPGQHARHYCPIAPAYRFEATHKPILAAWCRAHPADASVFLLVGPMPADDPLRVALSPLHRVVEMPADADDYARLLYQTLHQADAANPDCIWVQWPADTATWLAVHDRLRRATLPMPSGAIA